mmetsp:Transcript_48560/g.93792  ORF Transcript_48560/g.93792 Transcript_48560/m.93792 type:complete len:218 (-) Transcript_48560:50-703(-)
MASSSWGGDLYVFLGEDEAAKPGSSTATEEAKSRLHSHSKPHEVPLHSPLLHEHYLFMPGGRLQDFLHEEQPSLEAIFGRRHSTGESYRQRRFNFFLASAWHRLASRSRPRSTEEVSTEDVGGPSCEYHRFAEDQPVVLSRGHHKRSAPSRLSRSRSMPPSRSGGCDYGELADEGLPAQESFALDDLLLIAAAGANGMSYTDPWTLERCGPGYMGRF